MEEQSSLGFRYASILPYQTFQFRPKFRLDYKNIDQSCGETLPEPCRGCFRPSPWFRHASYYPSWHLVVIRKIKKLQ